MSKTILITGTSSGIGHAATLHFAAKGWTVFAGSRHPERSTFGHSPHTSNIIPVAIDVTDPASVAACFKTVSAKADILDAVVNNAGFGFLLPFEDTPPLKLEEMFCVNVLGLMDVCRHAVQIMRPQGRGTIVNVSSILGLIGAPFYAAYSSTKWAVEGFSESLAHEVAGFNVRVKIIEPGGTKTQFHAQAYDTEGLTASEPYRAWYERRKKKSAHDRAEGRYAAPEDIAALIEDAINDPSPRLRYGVPEVRKMSWSQRLFGHEKMWRVMHRRFGARS